MRTSCNDRSAQFSWRCCWWRVSTSNNAKIRLNAIKNIDLILSANLYQLHFIVWYRSQWRIATHQRDVTRVTFKRRIVHGRATDEWSGISEKARIIKTGANHSKDACGLLFGAAATQEAKGCDLAAGKMKNDRPVANWILEKNQARAPKSSIDRQHPSIVTP